MFAGKEKLLFHSRANVAEERLILRAGETISNLLSPTHPPPNVDKLFSTNLARLEMKNVLKRKKNH